MQAGTSRNLALSGDYGLLLAELATLIAPPVELVLLARERAGSGRSPAP